MLDIIVIPEKTGKLEMFTVDEFYLQFNIKHAIISNIKQWQEFILFRCNLPMNYVPDEEDSGLDMEQLADLDRNGYICDTECYSIACYFYNGSVFATPYQDKITSGEHVTNAFQKLCGAIEATEECNIFWR